MMRADLLRTLTINKLIAFTGGCAIRAMDAVGLGDDRYDPGVQHPKATPLAIRHAEKSLFDSDQLTWIAEGKLTTTTETDLWELGAGVLVAAWCAHPDPAAECRRQVEDLARFLKVFDDLRPYHLEAIASMVNDWPGRFLELCETVKTVLP